MPTSRPPRLGRLGRSAALGTLAAALALGATTAPAPVAAAPAAPAAPASAPANGLVAGKIEFGPTDLPGNQTLLVRLVKVFGDGSEPAGTITLRDGAGNLIDTATVVNRAASFWVPPAVTHVVASFSGGGGWLPAGGETDVKVAKGTLEPVARFSATRLDRFQPLSVGISVFSSNIWDWHGFYTVLARPEGTTGDDDIRLSQGEYPAPAEAGSRERVFDISALTEIPGSYQIHFQATETAWHQSFTGLVGRVVVDQARQPTTTAASTPTRATYGSEAARVGATLDRGVDRGPVNGAYQALVDGQEFGKPVPVTGTNEVGISLAGLSVGNHVVRVRYTGGDHYAPSLSEPTDLAIDAAHSTSQITSGTATTGGTVTVRVSSTDSATVPTGTVVLREGERDVVGGALRDGIATLRLPAGVRAGTHTFTAVYEGTGDVAGSTSAPRAVRVAAPAPVASRVTGSAVRRGTTVTLRAVVSSSKPVTGRVQVLDGRRVVRTLTLAAPARGRVTTVVRGLRPGAHALTVRYLGSSTVKASARTWRVSVPRRR